MKEEKHTNLELHNVIKPDQIEMIIPQCCREGWENCPHVAKKQRKTKKNIGL